MAKRPREAKRPRSPGSCIYCGLAGHNRTGCWVMADRRAVPDAFDEMVQRLIPSDIKAVTVADLRRGVARALRELALERKQGAA